MKKAILLFGTIFLFSFYSNATVWTVSNNPADSAATQFSNLQTAIDAAAAGDSIYVSASPVRYPNITINKELHLFGAGYNADKQGSDISYLTEVYLDTIASVSGSSGSSFQGFKLSAIHPINYTADNQSYCNKVLIQRNYIETTLGLTGLKDALIINNIVQDINTANDIAYPVKNTIVSNNIIKGYIAFYDVALNSLLYSNNIFIHEAALVSGWNMYTSFDRAMFVNNIFYGTSIQFWCAVSGGGYYIEAVYCTWNNNISYGGTVTEFPVTGTNSGSGNLENVDPLFVSCSDYLFDFNDDFHLQVGSPGINAGTDGTDIGIYGGAFPFPEGGLSGSGYQTSQESKLPQIYEMNIQNTTVPVDGTLNIEVKAHTQQ